MQCPSCNVGVRFVLDGQSRPYPDEGTRKVGVDLAWGVCPECGQLIVVRRRGLLGYQDDPDWLEMGEPSEQRVIFPARAPRRLSDAEVPADIRAEFQEAAAVLEVSAKASAALSRRLLQQILRSRFGISEATLWKEISIFIEREQIPTYLARALEEIRAIGNFAAHPLKDQASGQIVDVEPGEAEWLLDSLEALVDFAFVQPRRLEQRREQINKKLETVGKPPLKP